LAGVSADAAPAAALAAFFSFLIRLRFSAFDEAAIGRPLRSSPLPGSQALLR